MALYLGMGTYVKPRNLTPIARIPANQVVGSELPEEQILENGVSKGGE